MAQALFKGGPMADTAQNPAMSEPIGRIEKVAGTVIVVHADGSREVLNVGDSVYQGD
jgi:hypothetical protein